MKHPTWKQVLFGLGMIIGFLFILAACSGPSEAEDRQEDYILSEVEYKWAQTDQQGQERTCAMIETIGMEDVIDQVARVAGDDSEEFRTAVRGLLTRECE